MLKRILLVSTSAHDMNGHPTGLWLEELRLLIMYLKG